jgi:hypothetical protein
MIRTRWHRYHHTPYILFLRKAFVWYIEDTSFELAYTLRRSPPSTMSFIFSTVTTFVLYVEHTCKHRRIERHTLERHTLERDALCFRLFR